MHKKKIILKKKTTQASDYFNSIIHWANSQFPFVCVLNSNTGTLEQLSGRENIFKRKNSVKDLDAVIAVSNEDHLLPAQAGNFQSLKKLYNKTNSFPAESRIGHAPGLFGFFNYDLKKELENLPSGNFDEIEMPLMHFFVPKYLFIFNNNSLTVHSADKNFDFEEEILKIADRGQNSEDKKLKDEHLLQLTPRISKKQYIDKVNKIKKHIYRGDIYEMNFCQEFYAKNVEINPVEVYLNLNNNSPMPFSCFYKLKDKYLLCSSPERYLKKSGNKIISQPIKGTIRRGRNLKEDNLLIKSLFENKKEKSENVMIVDLVRNDLSRIAKPGTVKVDELFGIYSYKNLHQMISTVSAEFDEKHHFMDVIKKTFPMGSMTGAPKIKAMELIEKFETTKRGLFSGAVGYIAPGGDFDFNVVIRSVLYNKKNKYISIMAGSAITAECDAEREYEECLLKAQPMFKALGTNGELLRIYE